jgi:hypothetical protein
MIFKRIRLGKKYRWKKKLKRKLPGRKNCKSNNNNRRLSSSKMFKKIRKILHSLKGRITMIVRISRMRKRVSIRDNLNSLNKI